MSKITREEIYEMTLCSFKSKYPVLDMYSDFTSFVEMLLKNNCKVYIADSGTTDNLCFLTLYFSFSMFTGVQGVFTTSSATRYENKIVEVYKKYSGSHGHEMIENSFWSKHFSDIVHMCNDSLIGRGGLAGATQFDDAVTHFQNGYKSAADIFQLKYSEKFNPFAMAGL